ncbi:MAG: hypothetical protein ABI622_05845 [Chloroflexota bacterium]
MAFERTTPGTGIGAEPGIPLGMPETDAGAPASAQLRLQILSTEHWSLLASRSLAWNESFARAGMFLTTLSGAMVALALVAQASGFNTEFVLFALVVLPVTLFVGVTTFLRMGASNWHDAQCVRGMNRIRGGYLEIAPEMAKYFVMSPHDDAAGIGVTMSMPPATPFPVHLIAGTPNVVLVLNGVLAGVIVALVGEQLGLVVGLAILAGTIVAILTIALHIRYAIASVRTGQASARPLFPSPPAEAPAPRGGFPG